MSDLPPPGTIAVTDQVLKPITYTPEELAALRERLRDNVFVEDGFIAVNRSGRLRSVLDREYDVLIDKDWLEPENKAKLIDVITPYVTRLTAHDLFYTHAPILDAGDNIPDRHRVPKAMEKELIDRIYDDPNLFWLREAVPMLKLNDKTTLKSDIEYDEGFLPQQLITNLGTLSNGTAGSVFPTHLQGFSSEGSEQAKFVIDRLLIETPTGQDLLAKYLPYALEREVIKLQEAAGIFAGLTDEQRALKEKALDVILNHVPHEAEMLQLFHEKPEGRWSVVITSSGNTEKVVPNEKVAGGYMLYGLQAVVTDLNVGTVTEEFTHFADCIAMRHHEANSVNGTHYLRSYPFSGSVQNLETGEQNLMDARAGMAKFKAWAEGKKIPDADREAIEAFAKTLEEDGYYKGPRYKPPFLTIKEPANAPAAFIAGINVLSGIEHAMLMGHSLYDDAKVRAVEGHGDGVYTEWLCKTLNMIQQRENDTMTLTPDNHPEKTAVFQLLQHFTPHLAVTVQAYSQERDNELAQLRETAQGRYNVPYPSAVLIADDSVAERLNEERKRNFTARMKPEDMEVLRPVSDEGKKSFAEAVERERQRKNPMKALPPGPS